MAEAPAWMVQAVVAWVDQQAWDQLVQWVTQEAAIAEQLVGQYPPWLRRMGWAALSPADRTLLAQAGPAEWAALLEAVARLRPAAGQLFWQHEAWFHRECARARDLFCHRGAV
jgi:hypothetical protein